jgi:isopentenyl phosphate kinase
MQGKWDATRELTRMGVQSVFINGTVPGRVRSFFAGEDVPRTVVKLKRK